MAITSFLARSIAVVIASGLALPSAPARSQTPTPATPASPSAAPSVEVTSDSQGVRIDFDLGELRQQASSLRSAPEASVLAFRIEGARGQPQAALDAIEPRIEHLTTTPWSGPVPQRAAPVPQTSDGTEYPDLAAPPPPALPPSPVTVLRRGWLRGTPVLVMAISPLFDENGRPTLVMELEATIPGALPLGDPMAWLDAESFVPQGASDAQATSAINPAATGPAVKIFVTQPGIQRVTGATLAAAGLNITATNPASLSLRLNGASIALETRGAGDGRLNLTDEIRFYAPAAGDRWNAVTIYWLVVQQAAGARMPSRDATGGAGAANTTATEKRVWRDNKLYDSLGAGANGDHWFAYRLLTGPGSPSAVVTIPITTNLPATAGTLQLAVAGSAQTAGQHHLTARIGAVTLSSQWSGSADWVRSFTFTNATANGVVVLTLVSGAAPDSISIANVRYTATVGLSFANQGRAFSGSAGVARYRLTGTPANRTLYDVTTPQTPTLVVIQAGTNVTFSHGAVARDYVLAGPGTLFTPQAVAHAPVNLVSPRNANLIFIAPASLHAALGPLVSLRQGFTTFVVGTQAIYDTWSYGHVSPDAIRNFLRHAASTWPVAPRYVTLVGDGTSDPHDYAAHGASNVNLLPPYLAMVDPWIRETACDTCYGQLDGENPLSDPFPDVPIGRLPVKSAGELTVVVNKIVRYETAATGPLLNSWRSRAGFLADNYREANGVVDAAGDFAAMADWVVALQPKTASPWRVYYDPYLPTAGTAPWRESKAVSAYTRTIELFNAGVGLMNFHGHAHQFQIASTANFTNPFENRPANYLFYMYDADRLTNADRLPIMLELTCYTSAFQTPLSSGTTLDERLILAAGGAIAVWGNTGKGVAYGDTFLQQGFYAALWRAPAMTARVGDLAMAGYLNLLTQSACCHESVNTYVVMGDPSTRARVFAPKRYFMPRTSKR